MPRVTKFVQTLNKDQQRALHRVWLRNDVVGNNGRRSVGRNVPPLSYREFRKTVQFSYDCAMVPWCGMWLGIEEDGYTHS